MIIPWIQSPQMKKKQNNRFDLTKVNLDILPNYILNNLEKYKSWID